MSYEGNPPRNLTLHNFLDIICFYLIITSNIIQHFPSQNVIIQMLLIYDTSLSEWPVNLTAKSQVKIKNTNHLTEIVSNVEMKVRWRTDLQEHSSRNLEYVL